MKSNENFITEAASDSAVDWSASLRFQVPRGPDTAQTTFQNLSALGNTHCSLLRRPPGSAAAASASSSAGAQERRPCGRSSQQRWCNSSYSWGALRNVLCTIEGPWGAGEAWARRRVAASGPAFGALSAPALWLDCRRLRTGLGPRRRRAPGRPARRRRPVRSTGSSALRGPEWRTPEGPSTARRSSSSRHLAARGACAAVRSRRRPARDCRSRESAAPPTPK